jgi:hypothetical protein
MGKIVKYATDMVQMFDRKMDATRVGTRYGNAKDLAGMKYAAAGLGARFIIESARSILSAQGVPAGRWGVHIAFALKLWKIAQTYAGTVPTSIIDAFVQEYTLKGATPAVLDQLVRLVVAR